MIYQNRDEVERIGRAGAQFLTDGKWPAYRYLSSFWLYVEPNDLAFTPHAKDGFWESWVTLWLSKQFDNHDLFLDIGANVGYYTMMAGKHGISTISYEPNPDIYEMLLASVRLNKLDNVLCQKVALSDKAGYIPLYVPEGHSGAASIAQNYAGTEVNFRGVEVPQRTLDSEAHNGRRILMKIDAEGAEPGIWYGMQQTLRRNMVTAIIEWDTRRWSDDLAYKLSTDIFMTGEVGILDGDGNSQRVLHQSQLMAIKSLEMITVRNW